MEKGVNTDYIKIKQNLQKEIRQKNQIKTMDEKIIKILQQNQQINFQSYNHGVIMFELSAQINLQKTYPIVQSACCASHITKRINQRKPLEKIINQANNLKVETMLEQIIQNFLHKFKNKNLITIITGDFNSTWRKIKPQIGRIIFIFFN